MILPDATTLKLLIGILCALALALLVHDRNRWKSTATLRQQQVVAEKAAHLATACHIHDPKGSMRLPTGPKAKI